MGSSGFQDEYTYHYTIVNKSFMPDWIFSVGFFVFLMAFCQWWSLSKYFLFCGCQFSVSMITPAKGRKRTPAFRLRKGVRK